jgi:Icc-related predicted phosphoesterase
MKICFISDTHALHDSIDTSAIPECDVLVHSGDITRKGDFSDIKSFCNWLDKINQAKHKIVVAGNHDFCLETRHQDYPRSVSRLEDSCKYLFDNEVILEGVKFYGSPWQPKFNNWAFNLPRDGRGLYHCWNLIPNDTDVLISHGPPNTFLDKTSSGENAGCKFLMNRVQEVCPAIHAFGHIHESYGTFEDGVLGTIFVNASTCNLKHEPINKPVLIEYCLESRIGKILK